MLSYSPSFFFSEEKLKALVANVLCPDILHDISMQCVCKTGCMSTSDSCTMNPQHQQVHDFPPNINSTVISPCGNLIILKLRLMSVSIRFSFCLRRTLRGENLTHRSYTLAPYLFYPYRPGMCTVMLRKH